MSRNVKMSVFGFTNTGKTCYLLSMFAKMGMGCSGFKFCTSDEEQYQMLMNAWEDLQDRSKLPNPSNAEMDNVKFLCQYGSRPIAEFDWQDYPGGDLKDVNKISVMIDRAGEADCQMFFIPTNHFLDEDPTRLNECVLRFSTIIAKTFRYCQEHETAYPSFAIVLSKFDLVPFAERKATFYRIVDKLKDKFGELFSEGCVTMVTGISLGDHLGVVNNTDNGGFLGADSVVAPLNMPMPILFAIRGYLNSELAKMEDESCSTGDKIRLQERKSRWWRTIISGPKSVSLARSVLADMRQDQKCLQARNDDFVKRINFIKQAIESADYTNVYCNGDLCSGKEGGES